MKARTLALLAAGTAGAAGAAVMAARRGIDGSPLATLDGGERFELKTSDGAVLAVDISGPDDGPTVVLAHCWGGDIATWAPVAARLVDGGHRVVRWHQRGHGPSTVGAAGFAIERFGADLAELLDHLDLHHAVVAGHSLGGMTAQAFAVHHPEVMAQRVAGLVLAATASGGLARTPLGRMSPVLLRGSVLDRAMGSRYGHLLVRGTLGHAATPAAVRATRDHFVGTPLATRVGIAAGMMAMDLRELRRSISVPTTVVVGTRDTLTPPSHSRGIAADIPGARLVIINGAGHMLPYEATEQLADIITEHVTEPAPV